MPHNSHHKELKRLKRTYKHFAAAIAGAAIMSAVLPGIPAAMAHAAVNPNAGNIPSATVHKVVKEQHAGKKLKVTKKTHNRVPNDYKEVMNIKATAYAPGERDNDQWGDKTYLGTQVRPGVIAVDPDVIPLGSKVYIQYPDGHGEYVVAEDTGGAIKGNRIDIAMRSDAQAEKFGIQDVKVYIVNDSDKV